METSATQWHRPSAFTRGSRRATLHGLAGCDLQVAPGELVLLKASCASYFALAKYSTVQLFTCEARGTALAALFFMREVGPGQVQETIKYSTHESSVETWRVHSCRAARNKFSFECL